MQKEVRKTVRLSEQLDDEIEKAARKRGMNWSEMVRHILTNHLFNGKEDMSEQSDA
jgi:predicted DNA binding CopG/RHH family protein